MDFMRYQGQVIQWDDIKGFGFIAPEGGGQQVFVHIRSLLSPQRRPVGGERVSYELGTDRQGRTHAVAVAFAGERITARRLRGRSSLPLIVAGGFLGLVALAVFAGRLPAAIFAGYLVASSICFLVYAFDKSAAVRDRRRVPEQTLHLLAVIGGWPGAVVAQRLLRHKTIKTPFQIVFWITVILNCAALAWCLSPAGASLLQELLPLIGTPADVP